MRERTGKESTYSNKLLCIETNGISGPIPQRMCERDWVRENWRLLNIEPETYNLSAKISHSLHSHVFPGARIVCALLPAQCVDRRVSIYRFEFNAQRLHAHDGHFIYWKIINQSAERNKFHFVKI